MYEIRIGREIKVIATTIKDAFTIAISAYHNRAEVDVINTLTGEVVLSLMDEGFGGVYVASSVVYGI